MMLSPKSLHNGLPFRRDWFCQNCNHLRRDFGRITHRCRHRTAGRDDQKRGVKIMQLPYQRVRVARQIQIHQHDREPVEADEDFDACFTVVARKTCLSRFKIFATISKTSGS